MYIIHSPSVSAEVSWFIDLFFRVSRNLHAENSNEYHRWIKRKKDHALHHLLFKSNKRASWHFWITAIFLAIFHTIQSVHSLQISHMYHPADSWVLGLTLEMMYYAYNRYIACGIKWNRQHCSDLSQMFRMSVLSAVGLSFLCWSSRYRVNTARQWGFRCKGQGPVSRGDTPRWERRLTCTERKSLTVNDIYDDKGLSRRITGWNGGRCLGSCFSHKITTSV